MPKLVENMLIRAQYAAVRTEFTPATKRWLLARFKGACAGNVPGVKCLKPGVKLDSHLRAYDHIVPSRAGGLPISVNGQILCLDCHAIKSKMENKFFPRKNSQKKFNLVRAMLWIDKFYIGRMFMCMTKK
jgi:hypothetical protein